MENHERIPVFFTIDDKYAPILDVAIRSLTLNASPDRRYVIYIICDGLTEENGQILKRLADPVFDIRLVRMALPAGSISDRRENHLRCDYFTLTIFFRLFIAEMFPQYDKGIYLDSDIVVPGDISKLYDTELGDNLIGACADRSVSDVPELVTWIEKGVGVGRDSYVNSGILLMNLERLRRARFSDHFMKLLNTFHFESIAPDQDYINAICEDRILFLGEEWDVMPNARKPEHPFPQIIHYNLFDKPWHYDGVQYSDYFWKYARSSDFYSEICAVKDGYSADMKDRDRACMEKMLERAVTAPDTGMTFAKAGKDIVKIKMK